MLFRLFLSTQKWTARRAGEKTTITKAFIKNKTNKNFSPELPIIIPPPPQKIQSAEVHAMNADGIWRLFVKTGDPNCYLVYKAMERTEEKDRKQGTVPELGANQTDTGSPRM